MPSLAKLAGLCVLAAAVAGVAGCGMPQRFDAVPSALAGAGQLLPIANSRFAGDDHVAFEQELRWAIRRENTAKGVPAPGALLALSGGGEDGAFGAGLLVGWSAHGTRPSFKIVTGTSTGALVAPFAFLGSDFDATLERIYTKTEADDVIADRTLLAAVANDAMLDNTPLKRSIAKYIDPRVLDLIATEYHKGRLLLISTTNLDGGRSVVWNIGAIAASSHPRRLELVRKIMLASTAVPGMFPPVMLDVLVESKPHQEMHVDGGTVSQVFVYPSSATLPDGFLHSRRGRPGVFVIRNGRIAPSAETVERRTLAIAGRAIETMIASNGLGDLYRIFATTQRDRIDFRLAMIEPDFTEPLYGRSTGNTCAPCLHMAAARVDRATVGATRHRAFASSRVAGRWTLALNPWRAQPPGQGETHCAPAGSRI